MIGVFVPWSDSPKSTTGTAGWIVDGNACHLWMGSRDRHGYGHVWHDGKMRSAHRLRYELEVGPIPEGMDLDHYVCDNGAGGCCNPLHVRPTTRRENLLRGSGIVSDQAARTHCPRGHPLEGNNLVPYQRDRGKRSCKTCYNQQRRARYAARTAMQDTTTPEERHHG